MTNEELTARIEELEQAVLTLARQEFVGDIDGHPFHGNQYGGGGGGSERSGGTMHGKGRLPDTAMTKARDKETMMLKGAHAASIEASRVAGVAEKHAAVFKKEGNMNRSEVRRGADYARMGAADAAKGHEAAANGDQAGARNHFKNAADNLDVAAQSVKGTGTGNLQRDLDRVGQSLARTANGFDKRD